MTEPTHRAHACPRCNITITADNDKEFESMWETHKAEHKAEDDETVREGLNSADETPTAEDLAAAQAKTKAQIEKMREFTKLMEAQLEGEDDALHKLEGHYDALSKIEHRLPQLIAFGFKLGNAVGAWCKERKYSTRALKLGTIYWTPQGDIAADFDYDPYDLSVPKEPDYLKQGYKKLPALHAQYPAVFELIMTLGDHLVNICNNRKIHKRDISFTNVHHFTNAHTGHECWAFKILNRQRILRAGRVGL